MCLTLAGLWVSGCAGLSPGSETRGAFGDDVGFDEEDWLVSGGTGRVVQEVTDPPRRSYARANDASARVDPAAPAPPEDAGGPRPSAEPPADPPRASDAGKRLLVFEGRFQLLVPNVTDAVSRFQQVVEAKGGYLQIRNDAHLTFRVPAEHFKSIVTELSNFGVVTSESLEARDVTREYLDLNLRIDTLTQALERLTALLARAEKVGEILEIEREARRLTEEIERMRGELRFLQSRIAYSTLHVHFESNAPAPRPFPQRKASRFPWVNEVGIEQTLRRF